ncbi:MAG: hypothetical protein KF814_09575 [Nitrospiraceae bacterium]|nr:hypothetical protein [Nitrospiraceae bacterium]
MTSMLRSIHACRDVRRVPLLTLMVTCLLVGIRLTAALVCATCFTELEKPPTRTFHLHAGGDRDPCHHGQAPATPWVEWACSVNQDDSAFLLPEISRLPILVSTLVPFFLPLVSYRSFASIAANGRAPPPYSFVR